MASKKIQGIQIDIDGNTSSLKEALKDVDKNLYNVNQELNQVNNLLKFDPTNTELISQKQKLLSDAINDTSEKLKTLKTAKEQADKQLESGDMSEEAFRELEREIISTEQKLESLNKQFESTNDTTKKIDLKSLASNLGNIGKIAGEVVLKVAELTSKIAIGLAGAISAVGGKMVSMAKDSGKFADDLITLSNQTNISTDTLQKWDYASRFIDTDVDTMTKSMAKMTKSLDTNKDSYKKLGVSLTDTSGKLRSQEDIFMDTIDALGKIENNTERDALSMELFGKSAQELNPLIKAGGDELRRLGEEAENAGLVVGGDTLDQFGSFDDMMQRMDAKFTGLKNNITASFMPAIAGLAGPIEDSIGSISSVLADGLQEEDMSKISEIVQNLVENLGNQITTLVPKLLEFVVPAINTLVTMIVELLPSILPMLIDGAFTLLNGLITAIVENIDPLVNMVTTLINNIVSFITTNLPLILDAGIKILLAIIDGIAKSLPQLIPAIVEVIQNIIVTIIDNLPLIIETGIDILVGLIEGLTNAIPTLVDMLPTIIETIITVLISNLPLIIEAGIKILLALIEGIIKTIPSLVLQVPKLIATIVKGITNGISKLFDVGKNIVKGIWEGISNSFDWIKDKLKSWVGNVVKFIKKIFGINSPSKLMEQQVGENLGLGVAEGIDNTITDVEGAMKNLSSKVETSVNPIINPTANTNPLIIQIENFNNTRETDIQSLAEELEFYRKNTATAKGGN